MEVGTPASGIEVALSANALMPRHGHLESRYLGPRSIPPTAPLSYLLRPRVAVAGKAMVFLPEA